jgi:hypothetical protein
MTGEDDGFLTNPEPWREKLPAEVFTAFAAWAQTKRYEITHMREIAAGLSGSYLARIRLRHDGKMTNPVLKIVPPEISKDETARIRWAREKTPTAFWDRHMVEVFLDEALPGTHWYVHLQQLAFPAREFSTLADRIDDPTFTRTCSKVVAAVAQEWPSEHEPKPRVTTPREYLEEFLAPREEGLRDFAAVTGLPWSSPPAHIAVPGRVDTLPNPLALLAGTLDGCSAGAGPADQIELYVTNGHGDFNLGNIVIPVRASQPVADDFRLIDYGRFSPETPVARDPSKLVLSVAAEWLPALAPDNPLRTRLAEVIAWPEGHPDCVPITGYLAFARAVHEAAASWYEAPRDVQDWERQHLLVHLASALRFAADTGRDIATRQWFFQVAALATHMFVEFGHERTGSGQVTALRRVDAGTPVPTQRAGRAAAPGDTLRAAVVEGLKDDWPEVAHRLGAPAAAEGGPQSADSLWEWMEHHGRMIALRELLRKMGLGDLVAVLDAAS